MFEAPHIARSHPVALIDGALAPQVVRIRSHDGTALPLTQLRSGWKLWDAPDDVPETFELQTADAGPWHMVRCGGWAGRVTTCSAGRIAGWAQDLRAPEQRLRVMALDGAGHVVAHAVTATQNEKGGAFEIVLPARISHAPRASQLTVVIAGSDYTLDQGHVAVGARQGFSSGGVSGPAYISGRSRSDPVIGIKISTPNLKEAPFWGDYHFARSLVAAFGRIGILARVDTEDSWYADSNIEDVVLTIRGRHQVKLDSGRINLMWLISHPDRIPDVEFADYDHVAVASAVYAHHLNDVGLAEAKVLHQATDAHLFGAVDPDGVRLPACLFVGNSRREYRTMVKWCRQQDIPLELYGGGWEGVLPPGAVRAPSVANADLPACYGGHLLLLNDHWDSMRNNGFLSNRLFDGSATGTPILTDPVAGLEDVFGDTIAQAEASDSFAAQIRSCLENPAPWLARAARAREIVLNAHTFDHRAATLAHMIGMTDFKDPVTAQHVLRKMAPA